jgi:beta-glucosidase-like glycosyl hydrolase/CubicO group peptidase (beta-lactamase class C family)
MRTTNEYSIVNMALVDGPVAPPFLKADSLWVDSVFNTLTPDERITQLLMYPAYSNKDSKHEEQIKNLIKDYKIGGLIFMQGGPERQARLLNEYQNISKVPLLISMDAEWSLSMRLDSTVMYPRQMMLGAIQDNGLIYEMGAEFARQLKRVGVHISFSPDVDVNNNPLNPVINDRSFGEDKYNVSLKAYSYMKGLQDNGILATAKHFPGHGDTGVDSHKSLPQINHDRNRLDSIELYPFKYLIEKGIGSVMVSHLFVPAIDSTHNIPATLSEKAITELLINELNFKGLVITDAMNMGGITNYYKPGKADLMALLAGNDIILFPNDIKLVLSEIKKAIEENLITQEEIDRRCKKVLMIKYWAGLDNPEPVDTENLYTDLNDTKAKYMRQRLVENALTLVKNNDSIIPLKKLDSIRIATISFGNDNLTEFQKRINYYAETDNYIYNSAINVYGKKELINKLKDYDIVIASIHKTNRLAAKKFGISDNTVSFIDELASETKVILDIFANPYSLKYFKNSGKMEAVVVSYNDWDITNDFSAQLIFGGIPAKGRLPVTPTEEFPAGSGFDTRKIRLKYSGIPEEAGVDSRFLYKVDSIFNSGLYAGAYPGGQIVAARNEIVFYQKSFGNHTTKDSKKVEDFDIYDLASVTKVIGTNLALMKLFDQNVYNLDDKISDYLPLLANSNKKSINFKDVLTHRAGLKSWIPFYSETIKTQEKRDEYYRTEYSDIFSVQVADSMFLTKFYEKIIYDELVKSAMNNYGSYIYSDLGFYLMRLFIEKETNENIDNYLYEKFYSPLGAWSTCYLPLNKFNKNSIVPTEIDSIYRIQLLHGYVHDQGAAMLGGISGHAGLFSNANDIAKIMQMILNKGQYGGERFISEGTIELFTKYQFLPTNNRRGICWDKKHPTDCNKGIGSKSSSDLAYGHSGYTGTMVWADPQYNFLYVFNSNRVFPNSENWKIIKMNIRTEIEEVLYEAFQSFDRGNHLLN